MALGIWYVGRYYALLRTPNHRHHGVYGVSSSQEGHLL